MKLWIKLTVSAALLAFFFFKVGAAEVLEILGKGDLLLLFLAAAAIIATLLIDGMSLFVLVSQFPKVSLKGTIQGYLYSWSAGLLLPGRAGDLIIIPYFRKRGLTIGESLAAIITNKITSLFFTLLIAIIGAYLFLPGQALGLFFLLAAALALGGFFLASEKARKFVRKRLLGKYDAQFTGFYRTLKGYFTVGRKALALNLIFTASKIAVGGLVPLLLFYAIGGKAPFFMLVVVFNTATLLSFVPFTLSGLGLRESALFVMLTSLHIDPSTAGTVIALMTALAYGLGAVMSAVLRLDGGSGE
ncbi:flippase-like domain-containing protein [Candidatus Woesearchaeota archaeon]|nr:flippase-like domain-containing protein [Candidatus Woesearchaeota archaeon]